MIGFLLAVLFAGLVGVILGACYLSGALIGISGIVCLIAGIQLALRLEPIED